MRCPKCSCEVGNQAVCPFCGGSVYVSGPTWQPNDYARRTTVPTEQKRVPHYRADLERRLRGLEMKVNMLLVLQCGSFALMFLTLLSVILS